MPACPTQIPPGILQQYDAKTCQTEIELFDLACTDKNLQCYIFRFSEIERGKLELAELLANKPNTQTTWQRKLSWCLRVSETCWRMSNAIPMFYGGYEPADGYAATRAAYRDAYSSAYVLGEVPLKDHGVMKIPIGKLKPHLEELFAALLAADAKDQEIAKSTLGPNGRKFAALPATPVWGRVLGREVRYTRIYAVRVGGAYDGADSRWKRPRTWDPYVGTIGFRPTTMSKSAWKNTKPSARAEFVFRELNGTRNLLRTENPAYTNYHDNAAYADPDTNVLALAATAEAWIRYNPIREAVLGYDRWLLQISPWIDAGATELAVEALRKLRKKLDKARDAAAATEISGTMRQGGAVASTVPIAAAYVAVMSAVMDLFVRYGGFRVLMQKLANIKTTKPCPMPLLTRTLNDPDCDVGKQVLGTEPERLTQESKDASTYAISVGLERERIRNLPASTPEKERKKKEEKEKKLSASLLVGGLAAISGALLVRAIFAKR